MARVPTYDQFQATPNSLPTQGIQPVQAPAFKPMDAPVKSLLTDIPLMQAPRQMPDIVGHTLQTQGQQMSAAGKAFADHAIQVQRDMNQARVIEAKQEAEKAAMMLRHDPNNGYLSLKGKNAMERPGDMNMADEYTDRLSKNLDEINGRLGNEAQKKAFGEYSGALLNQFYGQAQGHLASESQTYQVSVYKGQADVSANQLSLDPTGPDAERVKQDIRDSHYTIARLTGKSEIEAKASSDEAISKASRVAVTAMVEQGNYGLADQYLQKHKDDFRGDDALAVRKMINQQQVTANIADVAQSTVAAGQPVKGDFGRLVNLVRGQESNGQQVGANGQVLTSRKGALGVMQVMPGTGPEAAKLAGEEWSLERLKTDQAYNQRLGTAYLQKQLSTYSGDERKALAAYNAGPGATNKAIDEANKKGGDFLQYLPKETQDYVASIYGKYSQGAGDVREATLNDMRSQAKAEYVQRNPGATQEDLDKLDSRVTHEYNIAKHDRTEAENSAVQQAYEFGSKNNWNWMSLPQSVKDAMPVDKRLSMEGVFAKSGAVKTNEVLFAEFMNKPPAELAAMKVSDVQAQYYDKFSAQDMPRALNLVASMQNKTRDSAADESTHTHIQNAAVAAGLLPANGRLKSDDEEGAIKYRRFTESINQEILQKEASQGGKKLDSEGVKAIANRAALEMVRVERNWRPDGSPQVYGSLSDEDKAKAYRTYKSPNGQDVDVPISQQKPIYDALVANGVEPSDQAIAEMYQLAQARKKQGAR